MCKIAAAAVTENTAARTLTAVLVGAGKSAVYNSLEYLFSECDSIVKIKRMIPLVV